VIASADRTPLRPYHLLDRLEIARRDNRQIAFGWGPHFCFGAALALAPGRLTWGTNLGLGGLTALPLSFRRPQ
jgi:hypothetical protein